MSFSVLLAASHLRTSKRMSASDARQHRSISKRRPFLFAAAKHVSVCVLWLICFAPATGRTEIMIEPRVGFHGVFQLGHPFPLQIELSNTGRPAEGMLDVRVWKGGVVKGGAPYLVSYRRDVFLASQSRKTVQLTIDPDFISRPLIINFLSAEARASREVDLRRYFSPAPVLLLLTSSSALPPLASSAATQSHLVSLSTEELPADSRALLGVSQLILYEQSLRDLSRSQILALDGWLIAGGQMLVIGSINYALYQEPVLGRFLPVRVTGAKQIAFAPNFDGPEPKASVRGVWTQTSKLINGQVVAESEGVPVIVEAHRGRGRVIYLAVDVGRPPLSEWNGLPRFLQSLMASSSSAGLAPHTEWNEAVFNQLIANPSFIATYVPSGSLLLASMVYLFGIGALTWFWQRRRLAARSLLLGFATLACAATAGGYVYFSRGGNVPDGVLLSSSVWESSGDDFVDAQANLALFSTQLRKYDLELERGWMELNPVSIRPPEPGERDVVTQEGGGISRYQLPLREWDYRLFRMRRIDYFPFRASFEVQGDRLVMKLENRSVNDLGDCWLLLPGQRFALGTIRHGAIWQNSFPLASLPEKNDDGVSRGDALSFREITFADKTRDILFHSSMFPRDGDAQWTGNAAVFVGWVRDPPAHVRINDPRIQVQDYTLFRAVFPLTGGEDE